MYKTINLQLFSEDETPTSEEQLTTDSGSEGFDFLGDMPEDTNDGEAQEENRKVRA